MQLQVLQNILHKLSWQNTKRIMPLGSRDGDLLRQSVMHLDEKLSAVG